LLNYSIFACSLTRILTYLIPLLLPVLFKAQNNSLDSLRLVLAKTSTDTVRVNVLNNLSLQFITVDLDSSAAYADKALRLATTLGFKKGLEKAYAMTGNVNYYQGNYAKAIESFKYTLALKRLRGDKSGMASTYNMIGNVYNDMGEYGESVKNQLEALKIHISINDKKGIASSYNNVGNIYYNRGNYPEAQENHLAALKIREEIKDTDGMAASYNNLGNVYLSQKDFEQALKNYLSALALFEKSDFKKNLSFSYMNVGNVYSGLEKHEAALRYYGLAMEVAREWSDKGMIALISNNTGIEYFRRGDFTKAQNHHLEALKIQREIGDRQGEALSLGRIGEGYYKIKKYKESEAFAAKCLALSEEIGYLEGVKDASRILSATFSETGRYKEALKHYHDHIIIRDSMVNEENTKKIVRMEMNFDFAKKETAAKLEKARLSDQNQIQSLQLGRRNYLIIGLGILLMIIVLIGWLLFRQNRLQSQQKAMQLEQKLLRSQMNPHFIFNSLATIESFIYENQPKEAGRYLSDFARLMRLILESSAEEYISLEKEIKTLEYYLSLQKLRLEDNLDYSIHVDESLDTGFVSIPPMLTQPFIENAIEHGFRGSRQTGKIQISFSQKNEEVVVEVRDNGIGINKASQGETKKKDHKSMAMQITRERLEFLNRSKKQKLSFAVSDISETDKQTSGTRVIFSIPM